MWEAAGGSAIAGTRGERRMDIEFFLKLMSEKNASDMFLTSGAPVSLELGAA